MSEVQSPPPAPEMELKRPGLVSQVIPYLITAAIFAWIFHSVNFADIWRILRGADLSYFIPAMVGYIAVFFFSDVLSFGQAYRWFNAPLSFKEMMECRGAPYVIQIGLAPLAETLFPLYLWRKKGVRVSQTLGSSVFVFLTDLAAAMTPISAAVVYNHFSGLISILGPGWLAAVAVFWVFYFANLIFWHSRYRARAARWIADGDAGVAASDSFLKKAAAELLQLLRAFSKAHWRQYLWVYAVRVLMWAAAIVSNYAALRAVGVDPPLPLAAVGIPIIVLSIFQPVSVGGYGGPQALAFLFFYKLIRCGTEEAVIAYSLLWSTCFLLGRAVIGLIFIRGFWRAAFPAPGSARNLTLNLTGED